MSNTRLTCSMARPCPKESSGLWEHPEAVVIGSTSYQDTGEEFEHYRCPVCEKRFSCEVPR